MAIVGPSTWIPTIDEFASHWDSANGTLGGTPATDMKLKGGYTRANFGTDRTGLQTSITDLSGLENNRQLLADQRDIMKAALKKRLTQFRAGVACYLDETPYVAALPLLPDFSSAESIFLEPFDDMANLWGKINADVTTPGWTAPLLLAGGYTLAQFTTDLAALRTTYTGVTDAVKDLQLGRERRNDLFDLIYVRLKQYRKAIEANFDETSATFQSMPLLTPPAGTTPAAVSVVGSFNPTTLMADLSWTPTDNPDADHYSLRYSPDDPYNTDTEVVVATVPIGTTTFSTNFGLAAPGSVARYKVYVVLGTGNEKGSKTVVVTRPET